MKFRWIVVAVAALAASIAADPALARAPQHKAITPARCVDQTDEFSWDFIWMSATRRRSRTAARRRSMILAAMSARIPTRISAISCAATRTTGYSRALAQI